MASWQLYNEFKGCCAVPHRLFAQALSTAELGYLRGLLGSFRHQPPKELAPLWCGERFLGWMPQDRANLLANELPECRWMDGKLLWDAFDWSEHRRSDTLQSLLVQHKTRGLLTGWRDERFSFWHAACENPQTAGPPFLRVERSGFRYLGMVSHAVHINGFLSDGRLWCGRRSLAKATDPGMLDNVAAGGLPSGEWIANCAIRELGEEAGLMGVLAEELVDAGLVRTARYEPQGWHDEVLHVRNLALAHDFLPMNQDGEVAEFVCLHPADVVARMRAGQFTVDAVASLVQGLFGRTIP